MYGIPYKPFILIYRTKTNVGYVPHRQSERDKITFEKSINIRIKTFKKVSVFIRHKFTKAINCIESLKTFNLKL